MVDLASSLGGWCILFWQRAWIEVFGTRLFVKRQSITFKKKTNVKEMIDLRVVIEQKPIHEDQLINQTRVQVTL